ncbi:MAG: hypothetical protein CL605_02405 [Altibacter sp.]|uniref:hypothetical protein n=1 Tax=Altibacter sp. TaxID=2024823 RepID=UPI000C8B46E8|nr:hypothetical protein [Altibacter sp.]MAP53733.1 hypothetical protein [Altibacter sp.]
MMWKDIIKKNVETYIKRFTAVITSKYREQVALPYATKSVEEVEIEKTRFAELMEILEEFLRESYPKLKIKNREWSSIRYNFTLLHDNHAGTEYRSSQFFSMRAGRSFVTGLLATGIHPASISNPAFWEESIRQFLASIRALDLFCSSVPYEYIRSYGGVGNEMHFDIGNATIKVDLDDTCNNAGEVAGYEFSMCIAPSREYVETPPADRWLTYYMTYSNLENMEIRDIQSMETMGLPNIIGSVAAGEVTISCTYCDYSEMFSINNLGYEEDYCDSCGALRRLRDIEDMTAEEDVGVKGNLDPSYIECPFGHNVEYYSGQFICEEHGVNIISERDSSFEYEGDIIGDYRIYDGRVLSMPDLYGRETVDVPLTNETLKRYFELEELLDEFGEIREMALEAWGFEQMEEREDFYYSEEEGLYLNTYDDSVSDEAPSFTDDRFNKMRGYIIASGIDVEINDEVSFEEALEEAIEKVEEIIEFTEIDSGEESDAVKNAKNLLSALQSMR